MQYKMLGDTGLRISSVSLGTAELGLDYGFVGAINGRRPDRSGAIRLVHEALDSGINCLDTAREYGASEELIGAALREISNKPVIVSKVLLPGGNDNTTRSLRLEIFDSVETSLRLLGVETLDVLLIHNTSLKALENAEVGDTLQEVRKQGKVRFLGASCYADEIPASVLSYPDYRVVQVPFSLLDQKMNEFFHEARNKGVGVFARSIYLRGLLTRQVHTVPARLGPLKDAALNALAIAGAEVQSLSELAIRFCLSFDIINSVLIGVTDSAELKSNLADAEKGPLPDQLLSKLKVTSFGQDPIVDTRTWQDVIV